MVVYTAVPHENDAASTGSGSAAGSAGQLTPDQMEVSHLAGGGSSSPYPAPSLALSERDSTYDSLAAPSFVGSQHRDSWGSNQGLAAGEFTLAGAAAEPVGRIRGGPPRHSTLAQGWNSPDDEDDSEGHIAPSGVPAAALSEKTPAWASGYEPPRKSRKGLYIAAIGLGLLVVTGLGIGLGVGLTRNKDKAPSSSTSASGGSSPSKSASGSVTGTATGTSTSSAPSSTATSGGYGSLITLSDGSTMTYENTFGGVWVWDEANPFNNDAQCNSWTPALNTSWTWGVDMVKGVNLGGWLNTEPFIVPALYEQYATGADNQTAVDEYTLSQNMGSNLTAAMTEHYETFITERDFAEIAAAGLNWVRIPLPHWAISTWAEEPYLEGVAWTYFLKAIQWARKYGIRINLDLHTVPGSQNGWNHSGKMGMINWMYGSMGQANAQRSLDYIRTLAQFISQDEYSTVIPLFGFINEPNAGTIGQAEVGSFYLEAYNTVRDVTGLGEGKGPMLSMHDGFLGSSAWYTFAPGMDRMALDQHPYLVFQNQMTGTLDTIEVTPCQSWATTTNTTSETWGVNTAGEFSAAINDCGLWVNGVGLGSRYDGSYAGYADLAIGSCDYWNDYTQWNSSTKAAILHYTEGSMDALQNWFFWTWKIGNSTSGVEQPNPFWHYRLGLANGWIPTDPRSAVGTCAGDGVASNDFSGTFSSAYMTGGSGAGTIAAAQSSSYPWPAASFTNVAADSMSLLPQYTQTGTPITLPAATYTSPGSSATINAGNGWANPSDDSRQAFASIAGCAYPSEYFAATSAFPTSACGAGLTQIAKRASPTPAPAR